MIYIAKTLLTISFVFILAFFLGTGMVSAETIPSFPMSFWGNVTINGGPAPVGTVVKAYYGDTLAGTVTVQERGIYGYDSPTKQKLIAAEGSGAITFNVESPALESGQEFTGDPVQSHSLFESGTSVQKNLDFTITDVTEEITSDNLDDLVNNGIFAPPTGEETSSATQVTVIKETIIKVDDGGNANTVQLPPKLIIKRTDGQKFDLSKLTASAAPESSLSGLGSSKVISGALKWGVEGLGLEFSQPITVKIFVGTDKNGQTLEVLRSVSGTSDWTSDGIVAPGTCTVGSGFCEFQATKASFYAAVSEDEPGDTDTDSDTDSAPSGGSVDPTSNPPTNVSITINSNADTTGTSNVALTLGADDATEMLIWNEGAFTDAEWENYSTNKSWTLPAGEGSKTVFAQFRNSDGGVSSVISDNIELTTEGGEVLGAQTTNAHPNGTLVLDGQTIYLIAGQTRRGFRTPEEYFSYGYEFSQAVQASDADRDLPEGEAMKAMEGTLVLDKTDNRTVYMIGLSAAKRGFTSADVFSQLGYTFDNLLTINLSDYPAGPVIDSGIEAHPEGALILDSSGTVWWVRDDQRQGFQSEQVFRTYGFSFERVVSANSADMALPEGELVRFRDGTLVLDAGTVFVISDGKKLGFTSMNALASRGYDISSAIQASLANYQSGSNLE